jgi:hypothetical protein
MIFISASQLRPMTGSGGNGSRQTSAASFQRTIAMVTFGLETIGQFGSPQRALLDLDSSKDAKPLPILKPFRSERPEQRRSRLFPFDPLLF